MQLNYLVEITSPQTHMLKVRVTGVKDESCEALTFFLPSWSPGSYLMREYSRNVRTFRAFNRSGEFLNCEQVTKGSWEVNWATSDTKNDENEFVIEYEVYCHEVSVRTSYIDESHAFLHGPSYLVGLEEVEIINPTIEFKFPPLWMKLHTAMKDISESRERFVYQAPDYDQLVDSPVEIGCHESDGFMHNGKEHHLVFYGDTYTHDRNLKGDIKKIVECVSSHFSGDLPYDKYLFITHFMPNYFGGLEHLNSTALHFDGRLLRDRKNYVNWLSLVAHEYFHTWNVKRIRPVELGPFNYTEENYTTMHWLTEGLTSFMDELFVLRANLCTLDEYLDMQKQNLQRYYETPGKKFSSLEDSSFNAWIKLYRPDENSANSSISYYLKGGLVFSTLHFELKKVGKSIDDLLKSLWQRYLDNPSEGMTREEVFAMVESIGNKKIREQFELRVCTTEDIDFESYYKECGMDFVWSNESDADLGVAWKFEGKNAIVDKVVLDGPAFKAGLNAGDEILAVNRMRFGKAEVDMFGKLFEAGKKYHFTISRLGKVYEIEVPLEKVPRKLKQIVVIDEKKAKESFVII